MVEFIGRERELGILEQFYGKPGAFLVYGRRRIGKTALLERFCEGKRHLFITCPGSTLESNLIRISEEIAVCTGRPDGGFKTLSEVLKAIGSLCSEERTVVMFDEFQNLMNVSGEAASLMQIFIDRVLKHTESMLILCGSSVRPIKDLAEDGTGPMFGQEEPPDL